MSIIQTFYYKAPFTELEIVANDEELLSISLQRGEVKPVTGKNILINETIRQLEEFFRGDRKVFSLPLNLKKYTPFQRDVWQILTQIPYGSTLSYKEIASKIDKPSAYRAVGNACGKNPFLLVIPCHRALKSDGRLGGFSAGIDLKIKLLDLEQRYSS